MRWNRTTINTKIIFIRQHGATESTEFSFPRFLAPFLAGYRGSAMFVDCDFLYYSDLKHLLSLSNDRLMVMVVKHDYVMKVTPKMEYKEQTMYPRNNWSSMVLYNCSHPRTSRSAPDLGNRESGAVLHRFQWLEDHEISSIPFGWNFMVGHNQVDENDSSTIPKAIHYMSGGPWFEA